MKKGFLIICMIICLLSIASAAASEVNDTLIASKDPGDIGEDIISSQDVDDFCEDTLAIQEDTIDDKSTLKDVAEAEQTLASNEGDNEVLCDGEGRTIKVNIVQSGKYVHDKEVKVKITDAKTGKGIRTEFILHIYDLNSNDHFKLMSTNSRGVDTLKWSSTGLGDGVFKIKGEPVNDGNGWIIDKNSKTTAKVTVRNYKVSIKAPQLKVIQKSKEKFKIKVIGADKKPVKGVELEIDVYTGKKCESMNRDTNSKGIVYYDVSKLALGKHKIYIALSDYSLDHDGFVGKSVDSYINVVKASAAIKAKNTYTFKKATNSLNVKMIDSKTKKPIKGAKLTLKFRGKTVNAKTNDKGKATFKITKLNKRGIFKATITFKGNGKYNKATKKFYIKSLNSGNGSQEGSVKVNVFKQSGNYAHDKKIYIKVVDSKTGKASSKIRSVCVAISYLGSDKVYHWYSDDEDININSKGIGVLKWSSLSGDCGAGHFKINVTDVYGLWNKNGESYSKEISQDSNTTAKVTVYKYKVSIKAPKLKVPAKSNKKFKINVVGEDKKPAKNAELKLTISAGKKRVTEYVQTNSKGVAYYDVSQLIPGKYKVQVSLSDYSTAHGGFSAKAINSHITVVKASAAIKAKKTYTFKKATNSLKAKMIDSKTKKPVKGAKLTLKVNGKTFNSKTNAKGVVKFVISGLNKKGNFITKIKFAGNKYYKATSKKVKIKIKALN